MADAIYTGALMNRVFAARHDWIKMSASFKPANVYGNLRVTALRSLKTPTAAGA